jgi:hypothetical protein
MSENHINQQTKLPTPEATAREHVQSAIERYE